MKLGFIVWSKVRASVLSVLCKCDELFILCWYISE